MISVVCEHGRDPMCCPYCLLRQNMEQQAELAALRAENEKLKETMAHQFEKNNAEQEALRAENNQLKRMLEAYAARAALEVKP